MKDLENLWEKVRLLEYHQKLLVKLTKNPELEFLRLIIENGLSEQEVEDILTLCDKLNKKYADQKADGYLYFHPLLEEFTDALPTNLDTQSVIKACITQGLYMPLFQEFSKYL
ncbi:DUF1878 family protein [Neobacillus muris]|uniref:DUF1878 family protein n=1 Tax=Neobacillus muris TaxID=2941334 RepID=UPI002040A5D8|nr:DUF1878 family protein [Neobacillus muris]